MECQYEIRQNIITAFKKNGHTIKQDAFCLQKDSIKYRFLAWHYNRKSLCKIRKLIILLSFILLVISGYIKLEKSLIQFLKQIAKLKIYHFLSP